MPTTVTRLLWGQVPGLWKGGATAPGTSNASKVFLIGSYLSALPAPCGFLKGVWGEGRGVGHFLFCDYCPTMPQQQLYVGLYSCCNLSLSHTHTHTHTHTHIYIRISLYPLLFHSVSIYYNLSRLIHFFSGFLFAYWFLFLWGILGSPLVFYCGSFWLIGWLGFSFSFWVILLLPN